MVVKNATEIVQSLKVGDGWVEVGRGVCGCDEKGVAKTLIV